MPRPLHFLCALAFLLRLFVAADPGLHPWDERYHALVAKNLLADPTKPVLYPETPLPYDYRHWSRNHVWLHKQPVTLYCIAASVWLFGNTPWAVRLPSVLLGALLVFVVYRVGRLLFSHRVGLVAAWFCAINGLLIELAGGRTATDHPDVFFVTLIALGAWCALRLGEFGRGRGCPANGRR